jgi:hypothetical protein
MITTEEILCWIEKGGNLDENEEQHNSSKEVKEKKREEV